MFSKIQPKATMIATITLVFVALALYLVPGLGLIFALFATIPGIVLWNKSIQSFGISALITVIITTVLGNTFCFKCYHISLNCKFNYWSIA